MQTHYKRLRDKVFVPKHGANLYLLHIACLLLLVIYPIAVDDLNLPLPLFTPLLAIFILFTILLPEKISIPLVVVGVGTVVYILIYMSEHFSYTSYHFLAKSILLLLFSFFVFTSMISEIVRSEISLRLFFICIDCYLILGLCFSFLLRTMHFLDPASFNFALNEEFNHIYMSFIILTSTGLGDLLPTSMATKAIVILNGLFGQIYLTFFAALIVGKYLSKSIKEK